MSSIFTSRFSIIFYQLLLPTSKPGTIKILVFPKEKPYFSKNRFSMLTSIFYQFLIQLGSLLFAKILQNQMKTRSKKASKNCQVFESIWAPFWGGQEAAFFVRFSCVFRRVRAGIGLGPLPGAELSTKYSPKTPVTPLRSILHRFWVDFSMMWGQFWAPHGSIFASTHASYQHYPVSPLSTTTRRQIPTTKGSRKQIPEWKGSAAAGAASRFISHTVLVHAWRR